MKPRNNREREVVRLSKTLKPISDAQIKWAVEKVMPHYIYTTGRRCWCTACGCQFDASPEPGTHECPHCHRKGIVMQSRKRTERGRDYIQIISTYRGWQVIRYFLFRWSAKAGGTTSTTFFPCLEKWCQPGRPMITLGTSLKMAPYWQDVPYSEYSSLSVKEPDGFHSEWMPVKIYPKKKLLPVYYRCGYEDLLLDEYTAEDLIGNIFGIPHFEALLKAGKKDELDNKLRYAREYAKFWPSIRVALRHGFDPFFKLLNTNDYFDYLSMLRYLGKDMRSPHYVAPKDWDDMHRRITKEAEKRRQKGIETRRRNEAIRAAIEEEERRKMEKRGKRSFAQRIKKFSELIISDDRLRIAPLMSVQEFIDEGAAMHHCVFANSYYSKPNSLILSARDSAGNRIETIEVDLQKFIVLQSRGVHNSLTPQHDRIVNLVNENMGKIQSICKRKGKASA